MCRLTFILLSLLIVSCSGAKSGQSAAETMEFLAESESVAPGDVMTTATLGDFNADSAYNYLARQVAFGPRVPNTEAHRLTGDWLAEQLNGFGADVTQQKMQLKAFDGTILDSRNIFARFPAKASDSSESSGNHASSPPILLLSHWDSRPWADQDPDPQKRNLPVDGANDGASGVAVLLEIARQISLNPLDVPVDILFVDAEDWGSEGDDDSWALGTKYFVENPPVKKYSPRYAVLLDMVGGDGAVFCREYYSERYASEVAEKFWQTAHKSGYSEMFPNKMGSAVMDDHIQLIRGGIPAIDIIEYHPGSGFNSRWHTTADNLDGISKKTLDAVGKTLLEFLRN